jgi:hypothetical protein
VILRIALAAVLVGAIGVMTGTIKPSKVLDRVPRVPHSIVPDDKEQYLDMVDDNLGRLLPLSEGFFNSCTPNAAGAGACAAMSAQMLRALQVFKNDLNNSKVPNELANAHATLQRAVAKGIEGFRYVQFAVSSHKRRYWIRARNLLGETSALLERAMQQLPAVGS